ncbi:hypothetical protein N9903_00175 [bacterium]|nr:hypothetical protein [bacterium]
MRHAHSALLGLFKWLVDREVVERLPRFPKLPKDSPALRDILTKQDQIERVAKLKEMTYHINPKIWLVSKILAETPAIRPGDIWKMREGDIRLDTETFILRDPVERCIELLNAVKCDTCHIYSCEHGYIDFNSGLWGTLYIPLRAGLRKKEGFGTFCRGRSSSSSVIKNGK